MNDSASATVRTELESLAQRGVADHDALKLAAPLREAIDAWASAVDSTSLAGARNKLLELLLTIGDNSNLTLDPDLDSYYTMSVAVESGPRVLMTAAQLHSLLASTTNGTLTPESRSEALLLLTRCADASDAMSQALRRAERANPALLRKLSRDGWERVRAELRQAAMQLKSNQNEAAAVALSKATDAIVDSTLDVTKRASDALDGLLAKRAQQFERRRNWIVGLTAAFCMLSAYFITTFYLSNLRGFGALMIRMNKVASGNLTVNHRARGTDEIGGLINAFNDSREQLQGLVSRIQVAANSIGTAGRQIAAANADLADRGSTQSSVAARAGEQGRGFAVVASEVRNLAQRSASAANEIKALIHQSVADVNRGAELVGKAGSTMNDILQAVRSVSHLVSQMAQASRTQAADIMAVEQAVARIDGDAQQNVAIVEQTAAAAGLLKDQVMSLLDSVSYFSLGHEDMSVDSMESADPAQPPSIGTSESFAEVA